MKNNTILKKIKACKINYFYYDRKVKKTRIVFDDQTQLQFDCSCKKVIEFICMQYGSTLKGRIEYCMYALTIYKKVPVLVSEIQEIIIFPLYGFRNEEAMWIAFNQIKKIYNEDNLLTRIVFKNNTELIININYRSIQSQMKRCKTMIKLLHNL